MNNVAQNSVCSNPAPATCETSQVLLAGVPGGFSQGSPVFPHLLIGPSHMRRNNLERDLKLNLKKKNPVFHDTVPCLKCIIKSDFFVCKLCHVGFMIQVVSLLYHASCTMLC